MPGVEKYTNTWMGVDFNVYWQYFPTEVVSPITLSDWLTQIYYVYTPNWQVFDSFVQVDVWHPERADCGEIKKHAGLCYPTGKIELNGYYPLQSTLSHEFGHWVMFANKLGSWEDQYGQKMWALYVQLRGSDATSNTSIGERWAEDFRYFFGCDGIRGNLHPADDFNKGLARHPDAVPGLKTFIKDFHRVLRYWRNTDSITLANASYSNGCWMWSRTVWWWFQQWEAFMDGKFYTWQFNRWVEMTV